VDVSVADRLCNELLGCLDRLPQRLLVDLAGVMFLDAAAVNALLLVSRSGARRGIPLILVAVPWHVQRVLKTLGLDRTFAHAPSVPEALDRTDPRAATRPAADAPGLTAPDLTGCRFAATPDESVHPPTWRGPRQ
jgi:anti-anti-sigma factor